MKVTAKAATPASKAVPYENLRVGKLYRDPSSGNLITVDGFHGYIVSFSPTGDVSVYTDAARHPRQYSDYVEAEPGTKITIEA